MSVSPSCAPSGPVASASRRGNRGVLVVATLGPGTGELSGADWIRIDGAQGTLEALADHPSRRHTPTLFDVPGPRTRRSATLLTTTEFLVFAAAEGFEWVNLRGVTHPDEVEQARDFLPPSTRLSVTVGSPYVLQRSLVDLCEVADAVLLARHELRRALGPGRGDETVRGAVRTALRHGAPPLLTSGLLPSLVRSGRPRPSDLHRLESLVEEGLRGLVLTRETTEGPDPQGSVDLTRLVADHARIRGEGIADTRPAARVGGRVSLVTPTRSGEPPVVLPG